MRNALTLVLVFSLASLQVAPDAHARRRAKDNDGPYGIAVAPFDGERAGGRTLSEAIELELELIETVLVKGDRWLRSDLRRAGSAGYEAATLRRIMNKRDVDILVRGRRAGDEVEVLLYGADGKPRFAERFQLPDDPDASAREMVEAMQPTLLRWPRAKVLEPESDAPVLVRSPERAPEPEPAPRVDEDDLFVEFEDEDEDAGGEVRDIVLDEPDPLPAGDDDEDRAVRRRPETREDERAEPAPRRRLLLDADGDDGGRDETRRPLLSGDDDELSRRPEVTMADVESAAGSTPLMHWIAVSAGGSGGAWYYEFAAAKNVEDDMSRVFTAYGGGARVSFWPIEYLGVDAAAAVTTFHVKAEGLPVRPAELDVLGISAGASVRARYPFKLGSQMAFAPGVRAGYRYWGSSVEPQVNTEDDRGYTLIPGWQMHALSVGVELYGAYVVDKWRFEGELHAEPLPFVRYEEIPDNPAALARPLGGAATLVLRIPIYAPVYVELSGSTTLLLITWDGGPGTRLSRTRVDGAGNRLRIDGGESLNAQFGGGLAIGASF